MGFKEERKTVDLIRQGIKMQAEATKKKEDVTTFDLSNQENLTQEQQIELLTKAVAELHVKVNGGNDKDA